VTFRLFLLVLASVSISAIAQVTLKMGVSGKHIQIALAGSLKDLVSAIATSPLVWLGLAMYFAGALAWLLVLARLEVSLAYPFVGLGFILTMLLGFFLLGETVSLPRIGGTLLVVLGVVLISRY